MKMADPNMHEVLERSKLLTLSDEESQIGPHTLFKDKSCGENNDEDLTIFAYSFPRPISTKTSPTLGPFPILAPCPLKNSHLILDMDRSVEFQDSKENFLQQNCSIRLVSGTEAKNSRTVNNLYQLCIEPILVPTGDPKQN